MNEDTQKERQKISPFLLLETRRFQKRRVVQYAQTESDEKKGYDKNTHIHGMLIHPCTRTTELQISLSAIDATFSKQMPSLFDKQ